MQLEQWLKKESKSQVDFGLSLNPSVSQGQVSQWIKGITRITLEYALQIDQVTLGAVSPQDCADMYKLTNDDAVKSPALIPT